MASAKKLTEQEVGLYVEAGRLANRIRSTFASEVKEGKGILEFAEDLEGEIIARGARPAFPCNVGLNEVGAHYTPVPSDKSVFSGGDLVKVDFGLHLDGYIVDTAFSVALSTADERIVNAVNESLRMVVENLKVGDRISEVGRLASSVSGKYGFKVIENLQGHEIGRYQLHAGISVPNVPNFDQRAFRDGMVVAIEPFMTYGFGAGRVKETELTTIFRAPSSPKGPRRSLQDFHGLPICERWVLKLMPDIGELDLWKLPKYPVLVEESGAPIAQAETTLMFLPDEVVDLIP